MSQSPVRVWRKQKRDKKLLGRNGVVLSWTEVVVATPQFAKDTPFVVVLVELEDHEKIYGRLLDHERNECFIGMKVRSTLRISGRVGREDLIEYGVVFKQIL